MRGAVGKGWRTLQWTRLEVNLSRACGRALLGADSAPVLTSAAVKALRPQNRLLLAALSALVLLLWAGPLMSLGSAPADPLVVDDPRLPASSGESLRDQLAAARVQVGKTACRWSGTRWTCGNQAWVWVGPYQGKASGQSGPDFRRCIWAHPVDGQPTTITFKTGDAKRLHGEAAILDTPHKGAAVSFEVRTSAGKPIRMSLRDGQGWQPWSLEGGDGELTVEIKAQKANWRHVCFTAWASP